MTCTAHDTLISFSLAIAVLFAWLSQTATIAPWLRKVWKYEKALWAHITSEKANVWSSIKQILRGFVIMASKQKRTGVTPLSEDRVSLHICELCHFLLLKSSRITSLLSTHACEWSTIMAKPYTAETDWGDLSGHNDKIPAIKSHFWFANC